MNYTERYVFNHCLTPEAQAIYLREIVLDSNRGFNYKERHLPTSKYYKGASDNLLTRLIQVAESKGWRLEDIKVDIEGVARDNYDNLKSIEKSSIDLTWEDENMVNKNRGGQGPWSETRRIRRSRYHGIR